MSPIGGESDRPALRILRATAGRLAGDARYGALFDYDRLVRIYDLDPPEDWSSMQALNAALAQTLAARHHFARHPFDQSLRNGSQTARCLLLDPDRAIQSVLRRFLGCR